MGLIACVILLPPANAQTNAAQPAAVMNASPTLRIPLLSDSTTAGTYPRMVAPQADQLEDVVRKLLAAEPDLPPTEVINRGVNGATVKSYLENYDRWIGKLLERLRKDHPQALLTLETVIPYKGGALMVKANEVVRTIAETEKFPLVDICSRFSKELELHGQPPK